ncbi:MAG TPA: ECF-type sigma factor [Bryobacteraceae bacterium]|nr:ECF-type sigma factor [Bryobacteraceae bacterium]
MGDPSETTQLLVAWAGGDHEALAHLTERVYHQLRRLARGLLRDERAAGTHLQSAELVHEAFVRMVEVKSVDSRQKAQFFALAATMMRRILTDRARRRLASKRGGRPAVLDLASVNVAAPTRDRELIALDDALTHLAAGDPRKARVVELRFFAGLSVEETARAIEVSPETVMRDWKLARAWLLKELGAASAGQQLPR